MKLKETFKYYYGTIYNSISEVDKLISISNESGLDPNGGVLVIDRVDASGTATPSKREFISYQSINGYTLMGVQRGQYGSTAQAHTTGSIIESVPMMEEVKEEEDRTLSDYLDTLL